MAAWTTAVRTWTVGEKLTAANLNAQLRDFASAFGAWGSYTTLWQASGTAPVLGNGTLVGAYRQAQKQVDFRALLTLGSTSTQGTGTWYLTTPTLPGSGVGSLQPVGMWAANPAGTRSNGVAVYNGAASQVFFEIGGASTVLATGVPGVWATGNILALTGSYESV